MQENKEREKVWGFNKPHNQANNELISELFIAKYFECSFVLYFAHKSILK